MIKKVGRPKLSGLTIRQRRFVDFLLQGQTQKEAYLAAGYTCKPETASVNSVQLLKDERVQKEIKERLDYADIANRARLRGIGDEALTMLKEIIMDKSLEPETKLHAILGTLDRIDLAPTARHAIDETVRIIKIGEKKKDESGSRPE